MSSVWARRSSSFRNENARLRLALASRRANGNHVPPSDPLLPERAGNLPGPRTLPLSSAARQPMRIGRTAVVTDTGRRRIGNEDAYVFKPPFFAIADGMGGARAGEIAAGLAATVLEQGQEPRSADGIVGLIDEANRRIWERSVKDPDTAGMGTTVTAALVDAE